MLHRSFKPAKCKTSLKLATSRIKLLKNKKAEQVKQLKRELAKLLESGQEQTARIRVEHVVREEKMMAAYDLIEIYCELIVARLPIIESQKNCPIDLKEAVASVVFAAPRCADIPELMDVRKHFTAKYGKDFVSGAVELRPDCGVSRLVVEKLSAKAPDGPTKIKILKAVADEHNIKWDHELLAEKESKPPDDLLNGPSTFEMAGRVPINPPTVQPPPSPHDMGPSNVQAPYQNNERKDVFKTYDELKARQSPQFDYSQTASQTQSPGTPDLDSRPSGTGVQRTEFRDSHSADGGTFSPGKQNWNMEFKDATAAAQAAAESAERASMAARAAAQLAGRGDISRQHSTESYKSSSYGMRDEMPHKDAGSTSQNLQGAEFSSRANMSRQHSTESHKSASYGARDEVPQNYAGPTGQRGHHRGDPVNTLRHESYSGMHHEQIESSKQNNLEGEVGNLYSINKAADSPKKSSSFKSSPSSFNGETSANELENADRYSRRNSSGKSQTEHLGDVNRKSGSSENIHEVRIRKQPSNSSSRSHSSSFGNDRDDASNLFGQHTQNDLSEGLFVNDSPTDIKETHPYDNASMAFDDSGSDDDGYNLDLDHGHKQHEYSSGFSPPGHQSSSHLSPTVNSWSDRQNVESPRNPPTFSESHLFTEEESAPSPSESLSKSPVTSQTVDLPVTFDNSDGPSSESEGELEKPKLVGSVDSNKLIRKESADSHEDKKDISSQLLVEATEDSDDPVEEPSSGSDKELKLGNLIGGLRNKGLRRPPYSRVHRSSASSSREAAPDTSPVIAEPPPAVEFPVSHGSRNQEPFKKESNATENKRPSTRTSIAHDISSDDESADDELPKQTLRSSTEEKFDKRGSIGGNRKPISTVPLPFFDSGNSDSEEDIPKRTSVNDSQPKTVFSRRTKTSDSNTESTSSFRTSVFADPRGSALENSSFSRRTQAPEPTPKTRPQKKESELQESYDQLSEPSVISGSPMGNSSFARRSQAPEAIRKTMPQKRDSALQESYDQFSEPSVTGGSSTEINSFSRRSQASEALPKTKPQKRDSELQEGHDHQHRRMEQEETAMENNSFSRRSQAPESTPKTRPQKRDTEHQESYDPRRRMEQAATPSENASFSRRSQAPEAFPKTRPQKRDSEQQENHDQRRRMERAAATKPVSETRRSSLDDNLRSSERKKPSNSTPEKPSPSGSAESSKTSSGEGASKPSHVHPKLPDFDTLSAHFQSLRQNRQ